MRSVTLPRLMTMLIYFTLCSSSMSDTISSPQNLTRFIDTFLVKTVEEIGSWNKDQLTSEEYQRKFCGKTCRGQTIQSPTGSSCSRVECFDCMCQRPTCEIYGICCPSEVSNETLEGNDTMETLNDPVLKCEKSEKGYYLYIQSCPRHFKDYQTRKLCEQDQYSGKTATLDQFARVSDTVTKVTYRNKYCALCNAAVKPVQWNVSVTCDHFLYVYRATTFDQLLSNILRPHSTCQALQKPLVNYLTDCTPKWFSNTAISSCKKQGLRKHDEDVERACLEMIGRSLGVYVKDQSGLFRFYTNIFCAICNMVDYPVCADLEYRAPIFLAASPDLSMRPPVPLIAAGIDYPTIPIKLAPKRQPPFKLILGFKRRGAMPVYESGFTFSSCKSGTWPSPDGQCLQLHCSPGKVVRNRTCVTALTQIRGLGYCVSMWFDSDRNATRSNTEPSYSFNQSSSEAYHFFEEKVVSHFGSALDGYEITLEIIASTHKDEKEDNPMLHNALSPQVVFWFQVLIAASRKLPRDDFEMRLATFVQNLAGTSAFQLGLTPRLGLEETNSSSLCSLSDVKCHSTVGSDNATVRPNIFEARKSFVKAEKNLNCQYVQFNDSTYVITKTKATTSLIPSTKLSLTLGSTSLVFTENSEFTSISMDEKGFLHVCREVLDSKLKKFEEERMKEFITELKAQTRLSAVEKAQYYLTLVCLSASMICLVLTLLTYFRFRVLRNQAGLNNIFLCGSLLMAQASLLASSHISGPRTLCTLMGMLMHFLWLWMFAWSFICCFHMFRVFTGKTIRHNTCSVGNCCRMSPLLHTVTLSLVCPTSIVAIVIFTSLGISGGSRTGYGSDVCYLDSDLLVGLATVLPLAVVTVSNAVFFTITVAKIRKARKRQSGEFFKKSDRTNLYIYIKLSTITGVFWMLLILAEGLNNDVLRFIAIVTNGLQGVFIFFSYMCNKRVLSLYAQGLRPKDTTMTMNQLFSTGNSISTDKTVSVSSSSNNNNNNSNNTDC